MDAGNRIIYFLMSKVYYLNTHFHSKALRQNKTCVCVCVWGGVIASNRGRKCDTLLSDRGRFENGDGPHPELVQSIANRM